MLDYDWEKSIDIKIFASYFKHLEDRNLYEQFLQFTLTYRNFIKNYLYYSLIKQDEFYISEIFQLNQDITKGKMMILHKIKSKY